MARIPGVHKEATLKAIDRVVDVMFRTGDSLFNPGKKVWGKEVRKDLYERFVKNPDESEDKFMVKYKRQVEQASDDTVQLAAELLYVQVLTPSGITRNRKLEMIEDILSWSSRKVAIPDEMKEALNSGLAAGQSFSRLRPWHLHFILDMLLAWDVLSESQRISLLQDPWEFKQFLHNIPCHAAQNMREILCFFVHPEYFECITSEPHKKKIAQAFRDSMSEHTGDVDQDIYAIRKALVSEYGESFHFYQDDIKKRWDKKTGVPRKTKEKDPPPPPPPPGHSLEALAEELFSDVSFLKNAIRLLEDKRQVIFYGPPGTGKTYVAQKLAEHMAGEQGDVRLVQFHPSYTYEDFFEGYRPTPAGGFELVAGPLKRLAAAAEKQPDKPFILIIDEINRGNLAKIFGELYFLLEYRDHGIELQYSHVKFRLPKNVWFIGTMNTADRSISLVDAALRRRFHFVGFFPDCPPVQGLLHRWLQKSHPEMLWVADVVDRANADLGERHLSLGPSHFMKEGLTEEWVEMIWKHSVIPYLEEHFFGQPERIDEFELSNLRGRISQSQSNTSETQSL